MANPKSQQYEVIKNGPLCLDKYCADIVPFGQGFNKKNSPMLGGAISNVFSKSDNNKKDYYSDGKNEIYYENGHITGNGVDYGSFTNQKFVIEDITLDGVVLNKDNCLDYVDSSNYILKDGNNLTIKVNSYTFTRSYNPNAFYKILKTNTIFLYLEYRRIYNDNNTFNVELKVAYNASGFIYDDICIDNVPTTVENNIRVEYGNFDGKFYIYIVCLNKEFEFSDDFHFRERIYWRDEYNRRIGADLRWVSPGSYKYRCLLEIDMSNNYSVRSILLSYIILNQISDHLAEATLSILYPVLSHNRIAYNIFKYVAEARTVDGSPPRVEHTLKTYAYPTNSVDQGNRFLNKDVYLPYSPESGIQNMYTFDDSIPDGWSFGTETYNFDLNFEDIPFTREFFYVSLYCCHSRNNYDNINNLCHIMQTWDANDDKTLITSDFWGSSLSSYIVSAEGQSNIGYTIGSSFGSGTTYTLPHYDIPTRSNVYNYNFDHWRFGVLLDENQLPIGISYSNPADSVSSFEYTNLGTIITPWNSIDTTMPVNLSSDIAYVDKKGNWKKIRIVSGIEVSLIGDFVLLNTTSKYNAIIISKNEKTIWANDWNNRIIGVNPYILNNTTVVFNNFFAFRENSAINSNWDINNNIPSSFMSTLNLCLYSKSTVDINVLFSLFNSKIGPVCATSNDLAVDVYIEAPGQTASSYFISLQNKYTPTSTYSVSTTAYVDSSLSGTQWKPGDIIYYNPTIVGKVLDTFQDLAYLLYDQELYLLHYISDGRYVLLYRIDTNIEDLTGFFAVQGQTYIISNNRIYKYTIENEAIQLSDFICDITGLKFLTFTPSMAYFWSDIDSSIYIFTADNIIRKLYTATDISYINNAIYYPSCNMTSFATNLGILCYHEDLGMFIIDSLDNHSGKLFLQPDGYITYSDNSKVIYYTLWFPYENSSTWTKNNIILATKFYGLGSNLISITDTWYFRLFADKNLYNKLNIDRDGKLKLSVDALTDKGISTETKEIDIKESDWDALTDTLYIRYQPKLQRGVGISLNVESPFAIGYLGLGNIVETTQMSRPSMQA